MPVPATDGRKINVYQEGNAAVSPAWRYHRAVEICDSPSKTCARWDDTYIKRARQFILFQNNPTSIMRNKLFSMDPGMYYAFELSEMEDPQTRVTIEARLLAGQSNEEIASLSNSIPAAIDCYEKVFFDVRDRLHCRDWIVNHALGDPGAARFAGDPAAQEAAVLRRMGYLGGPAVLDVFLSKCGIHERPESHLDVDRFLDKAFNVNIKRHAVMASMNMAPNSRNVMELFAVQQRQVELNREGAQMGETTNALEDNIMAMLRELKFAVGTKNIENDPTISKLLPLISGAVEPRDDELIVAARTGEFGEIIDIPTPDDRRRKAHEEQQNARPESSGRSESSKSRRK